MSAPVSRSRYLQLHLLVALLATTAVLGHLISLSATGLVAWRTLLAAPAAALVAGLVWVLIDNDWTGEEARWYAFVLTIFAGITMVSNLRYYSGKSINLRRSVPFMVVAAIALGFALVSSYPPGVLFALFLVYALSGYVIAFTDWLNRRKKLAIGDRT